MDEETRIRLDYSYRGSRETNKNKTFNIMEYKQRFLCKVKLPTEYDSIIKTFLGMQTARMFTFLLPVSES